ncbi:MAG: glycine--tRNA ligase subunit beta [Enterovibrio sp.]
MAKNFLVELGCEELPPKQLRILAQAFADNFAKELINARLTFGALTWHATPRRLALSVDELAERQPDNVIEKRGPSIAVAFDLQGNPTKAAEGWARGFGITVAQAERHVTDLGEWLLFRQAQQGLATKEIVLDLVANALKALPIAKPMRWGDKPFLFIRPIKTLCALFGDELIEGEIMGVRCDRIIRGHRFMGEREIRLSHADEYLVALENKGRVLADFVTRKILIIEGIKAAAAQIGGEADLDDDLLEEVTALVEWPVVLRAQFEEKFLEVPPQALVHTMKGDQKYFPVYDREQKLLPHFIFVSNIESAHPEFIIAGNEKVVRPRLADAQFFFEQDKKSPLVSRLERLESVVFQKQLGTLKDKTLRITELSAFIADLIGADVALTRRAALLAKCDLMTSMVFEFTETQGVMGMHYARLDGENEAVALALNEHYMPRFACDALPSKGVSAALALADKLDTLVGIFGIGQAPKGSDPFALRRAGLGVLRILIEYGYSLDLKVLIEKAHALLADRLTLADPKEQVFDFIMGRLPAWYQDQGFSIDAVQAVQAKALSKPVDFDKRLRAVSHFRTLDAAGALAAANKRVSNILAKTRDTLPSEVDAALLVEPAEQQLAQNVAALMQTLKPLLAKGDHQSALCELATLREPVDAFFENVMVMCDNKALQNNRLALLSQLRALFMNTADISLLQK